MMSEDQRHLKQADEHIAQSRRRIGEQETRLADMRRLGSDTEQGERFLENLRGTLEQMIAHRALIVERLERHW
jgi:hypothetical protein